MSHAIYRYIRQHHVGLVALFFALTGGTVAIASVGRNDVGHREIQRDAVRSGHIKDGHVTFRDIRPGHVTTRHIRDGHVTAQDIRRGNVRGVHVAESSLSFPAVSVDNSVDQLVQHNTDRTLFFNHEDYDTANMHDNVGLGNSRLVAPVDGIYLITAEVAWLDASIDTGTRWVSVWKNGVRHIAGDVTGANDQVTAHNVTTHEQMDAGDYVQVQVSQINAGSSSISVAGSLGFDSPAFSMVWISSAP